MHLWEKMNIEYRLRNLCVSLIYDKMLDETNILDVYKYAIDAEDQLLTFACEVYVSCNVYDLEKTDILEALNFDSKKMLTEETIELIQLPKSESQTISLKSTTTQLVSVLGGIEVGKK